MAIMAYPPAQPMATRTIKEHQQENTRQSKINNKKPDVVLGMER
jgi:hypothetical protein